MQPRWAKLQPLWVALVKQMLHAHVRYRNVVLRVVRHLPDIAGVDRVEDECAIEIPAHSAWRRLDPPPLCRHLWIVAVAVLRLGNHWSSLFNSRIHSPPIGTRSIVVGGVRSNCVRMPMMIEAPTSHCRGDRRDSRPAPGG